MTTTYFHVEKVTKRDQALLDTNNLNTILDSLDKAQGSNMELFGLLGRGGKQDMTSIQCFSSILPLVTISATMPQALPPNLNIQALRQGIMTSINLFDDPINSADKNNIAFTSRKDAATLPNCSIGPPVSDASVRMYRHQAMTARKPV